jgi:hypothetical protein
MFSTRPSPRPPRRALPPGHFQGPPCRLHACDVLRDRRSSDLQRSPEPADQPLGLMLAPAPPGGYVHSGAADTCRPDRDSFSVVGACACDQVGSMTFGRECLESHAQTQVSGRHIRLSIGRRTKPRQRIARRAAAPRWSCGTRRVGPIGDNLRLRQAWAERSAWIGVLSTAKKGDRLHSQCWLAARPPVLPSTPSRKTKASERDAECRRRRLLRLPTQQRARRSPGPAHDVHHRCQLYTTRPRTVSGASWIWARKRLRATKRITNPVATRPDSSCSSAH